MKWIKTTERMPDKAGMYTVRAKSAAIVGGQAYFNEKRFEFRQGVHNSEIEWLDEQERMFTLEEIGRAIYTAWLEAKDGELDIKQTEEKIFKQLLNN